MFKAVLFDKACWTQHLKLNPITGLDPDGIKLRAAQGMNCSVLYPTQFDSEQTVTNCAPVGLDAADYFVTG